MADVDAEELKAECVRFMGAILGWRTRAVAIGDDKLTEFTQRAAVVAGALHAGLDLHKPETYDSERWYCAECSGIAGTPVWMPCRTVLAVAGEFATEPAAPIALPDDETRLAVAYMEACQAAAQRGEPLPDVHEFTEAWRAGHA